MAQPKLLEQYRERLRVKHYSLRTEEAYLHWARRFIYFHGKRHPREMRGPEVELFLSHLATEARVPVVLTENEVRALFAQLDGTRWLAAGLLSATGMRLLEGLRLRVKDVDLEHHKLAVRDGKGGRGVRSSLDRPAPQDTP